MPSGAYDTQADAMLWRLPWSGIGPDDQWLDQQSRDDLTSHGRSLLRRDPVARLLAQRLRESVIRDGWSMRFDPVDDSDKSKALARAIEREFNECWSRPAGGDDATFGTCDPAGLRSLDDIAAQVLNAMLTDGDGSGVFSVGPAGTPQVEAVGGDQIRSPEWDSFNRPPALENGKHWQGFKWSARRATAMHVAKWTYGYEKGVDVPIEATVFMPMPGADPCGRIRGQSALGVTARRFARIQSFDEAVLDAARLQTFMAMAVKTESPESMGTTAAAAIAEGLPDPNPAQASNADKPRVQVVNGVSILNLKPGEDLSAVKPEHPISGYADYMLWNYMTLAADMGIPLAIAMYDPRLGNWSSLRSILAVAEMKRLLLVETFQRFYRKAALAFIASRILAGAYAGLPDDWASRVRFEPPPPLILDPSSEFDFRANMVKQGWMTNTHAVMELTGQDASRVAAQLEREQAMYKAHGIVQAELPGSPSKANPNPIDDPKQPNKEDSEQ